MTSTERRVVTVRPAFHRCNADRSKDYGIGDPTIIWTLHVGADAISWTLFTGWGMPTEAFHAACPDCMHPMHRDEFPNGRPMAGAVDWHMSAPVLDAHDRIEHCTVLDGPCYPDVGYLVGDVLCDLLRVEGDEAVWSRMSELLAEYRSPVEAS